MKLLFLPLHVLRKKMYKFCLESAGSLLQCKFICLSSSISIYISYVPLSEEKLSYYKELACSYFREYCGDKLTINKQMIQCIYLVLCSVHPQM